MSSQTLSQVDLLNPPTSSVNEFKEYENIPRPGKFLNSSRHNNYDEISAIKDLADNSIDAGADRTDVTFIYGKREKGQGNYSSPVKKIIITDNGKGMDQETLLEAFRLGSETDRDLECDLGWYGMGLITASISMGRRITIYTKEKDGYILVGIHDLDEMKNSFKIKIKEADFMEGRYFENTLERLKTVKTPLEKEKGKDNTFHYSSLKVNLDSGTVVIIDKLDQMTYQSGPALATALISEFGQTYRWFIKTKEKVMTINQENIPINDPIRKHPLKYNLEEKEIEVEFNGSIHVVKLYIAQLISLSTGDSKNKGINYDNKGFYIVRNYREIIGGTTLNKQGPGSFKIFPPGNHWINNLRIEMLIPAALDDFFKMTFSKNDVSPTQSFMDKLGKTVAFYIKRCEADNKADNEERKKAKGKMIDTSIAKKIIEKKKNLLKWPDKTKEVRNSHKKHKVKDNKKKKIDGNNDRIPKKTRSLKTSEGIADFEFVSLGANATIYRPNHDPEKGTVITEINIDNPFYTKILDKCSQDIVDGILLYFFTCCNDELTFSNGADESYSFICTRRTHISNEFASLMS